MKLNDKAYDVMKYIALVAMPALATLLAALGSIWCIPHTEAIVATVTALDGCLGALLGVSSANYYRDGGDGE